MIYSKEVQSWTVVPYHLLEAELTMQSIIPQTTMISQTILGFIPDESERAVMEGKDWQQMNTFSV